MTKTGCPQCGLTAEEFHKTGRLGCSECYRTFGAELAIVLRRLHGRNRHVGKVPALNPDQVAARNELLTLRRELKQAVEREQFQKAAQLRDRINEIERTAEVHLPRER
ncbi:MAG: UvrB/UvrC motif-containing protein [candidate division Zixibacteria bacterium]|nr:UvrB/UvrC motif-containing protein [candidate division Zixibacteria bacterium]